MSAAPPEGSHELGRAAIVFDSAASPSAKAYVHALFLENFLTHFRMRADLIPFGTYRAGQPTGYSAGFFIGATSAAEMPPALLADIRATSRPLTWMGLHIGKLLDSAERVRRFGFSFREYRKDLSPHGVLYKQTILSKEDADLNLVSVVDAHSVEVVATAVGGNGLSAPYVLRNGRFWYITGPSPACSRRPTTGRWPWSTRTRRLKGTSRAPAGRQSQEHNQLRLVANVTRGRRCHGQQGRTRQDDSLVLHCLPSLRDSRFPRRPLG